MYQTLFWILQGNRWNGIVYDYIEIYNSENISPQTFDILSMNAWQQNVVNDSLFYVDILDLAVCFLTRSNNHMNYPGAMYFQMSGSNVCASWNSIGRTNIFFALRVIPPKSYYPLTNRPRWYCRHPNFGSSISTIIPSPPIWLWLFVNHWFMNWEARLLNWIFIKVKNF